MNTLDRSRAEKRLSLKNNGDLKKRLWKHPWWIPLQANSWCRKGVNLLSDLPIEITSSAAAAHVSKMDEFLEEGSRLQVSHLVYDTDTTCLRKNVKSQLDKISTKHYWPYWALVISIFSKKLRHTVVQAWRCQALTPFYFIRYNTSAIYRSALTNSILQPLLLIRSHVMSE